MAWNALASQFEKKKQQSDDVRGERPVAGMGAGSVGGSARLLDAAGELGGGDARGQARAHQVWIAGVLHSIQIESSSTSVECGTSRGWNTASPGPRMYSVPSTIDLILPATQ